MANIQIKIVEKYDEDVFKDLVQRNLEAPGIFIDERDYSKCGERDFSTSGRVIRIGAFVEDKLIGLSWGEQTSKGYFTMFMSLVEQPYRRQGIYSQMLDLMLEKTRDFDCVDSTHHIFNNEIISLKLRRGFYITGFKPMRADWLKGAVALFPQSKAIPV